LALAGAGDELQGIKRGIMEMSDIILVTKADGDNTVPAKRAAASLRGALRLLHSDVIHDGGWMPPVLTTSATVPLGLDDAWRSILTHRDHLTTTGELSTRRADQAVDWLWTLVRERLEQHVRQTNPDLANIEAAVRDGTLTVEAAAERLLTPLV
jgi:LAO/AO transport system kinase